MMWAIVPLVVIAVVFPGFQMGNSSTAPDTSASPTAQQTSAPSLAPSTVPVDSTKVAPHLNAPAPTPTAK